MINLKTNLSKTELKKLKILYKRAFPKSERKPFAMILRSLAEKKGEFKNPDAQISRKSIAHLVGRCIYENFGIKDSLGINRP